MLWRARQGSGAAKGVRRRASLTAPGSPEEEPAPHHACMHASSSSRGRRERARAAGASHHACADAHNRRACARLHAARPYEAAPAAAQHVLAASVLLNGCAAAGAALAHTLRHTASGHTCSDAVQLGANSGVYPIIIITQWDMCFLNKLKCA